jgi:hypothetical protein
MGTIRSLVRLLRVQERGASPVSALVPTEESPVPRRSASSTSTEFLPLTIRAAASGCFYYLFLVTRRLSAIVGAEEIQGRSSGVAVIRPVNLLQTSTSIQRKNKPSARWEATSEFDPSPSLADVRFRETNLNAQGLEDPILVLQGKVPVTTFAQFALLRLQALP